MNLQEILCKQWCCRCSLRRPSGSPRRSADTLEERFLFLLVRLYAILTPLALLVTLLAPILLLSLALDAESAKLISSNISDIDKPFIKRVAQGTAGSIQCRTQEGFYQLQEGRGLEFGCVRGPNIRRIRDLVWCETSTPCLKDAKRFADAVKGAVPDAMLAYNCSPSFNWRKSIPGDQELKEFQRELGRMGFKFQFITLAGFHQTNYAIFDFANRYKDEGMYAYSLLQEAEFDAERVDTQEQNTKEKSASGISMRSRLLLDPSSTAAMKGQPKKTSSKKSDTK